MIDILNELLLLVPSFLFLIAMFFLLKRKKLLRRENPELKHLHERAKQFSIYLIISFSALLLFGNSAFGKARDWDLFIGLTLATGALGIVLFMEIQESMQKYLSYLLLIVSFSGFIPWLMINVNEPASIRYFRGVMQLDDRRVLSDYALNGYEHLRKAYQMREEKGEMLWAIRKKIELVGYPLDFRQAISFLDEKDFKEKNELVSFLERRLIDLFKKMNETHSTTIHAGTKKQLVDIASELIYTSYFSVDKSLSQNLGKSFETYESKAPQLMIASALARPYNDPKAMEIYEQIGRMNTSSAKLAYACGFAFVMVEQYQQAVQQFDLCVELDPRMTNAKFFRGVSHAYLGHTQDAIQNLSAFLLEEKDKTNPLVKDAEVFIIRLRNGKGLN